MLNFSFLRRSKKNLCPPREKQHVMCVPAGYVTQPQLERLLYSLFDDERDWELEVC